MEKCPTTVVVCVGRVLQRRRGAGDGRRRDPGGEEEEGGGGGDVRRYRGGNRTGKGGLHTYS